MERSRDKNYSELTTDRRIWDQHHNNNFHENWDWHPGNTPVQEQYQTSPPHTGRGRNPRSRGRGGGNRSGHGRGRGSSNNPEQTAPPQPLKILRNPEHTHGLRSHEALNVDPAQEGPNQVTENKKLSWVDILNSPSPVSNGHPMSAPSQIPDPTPSTLVQPIKKEKRNANKPSGQVLTIADIIQETEKLQNLEIPSPEKKEPRTLPPKPKGNVKIFRIDPTSSEIQLRYGKEKIYNKPNTITKLKRKILEEREEAYKKQLEENGQKYEQVVEKALEEISEKIKKEAEEKLIPLRKPGEREKRDYVLKKAPRPPTKPRVRDYCTQLITQDLDSKAILILQDLTRFQDRQKIRTPTMAKIKRRYVLGIREVLRGLECNKIKHIIVAPNLDQNKTEEGLDSQLLAVITKSNQMKIPVTFALTRKQIGRAIGKMIRLSIVGIYNPDGVDLKGLEFLALRNSILWKLQSNVQKRLEEETPLPSLETEYTELCTKLHQLQLSQQPQKKSNSENFKNNNNKSEKWTIFVVSSETHRTMVLTEIDRETTVLDLKKKNFELNISGTTILRPINRQKLLFNNSEIHDNTIIGNIPRFMNYSTLTLLRRKGPTIQPTENEIEEKDEHTVDDDDDDDSGGSDDSGGDEYSPGVTSPPPNGWRIDAAPFVPFSERVYYPNGVPLGSEVPGHEKTETDHSLID